MSQVAHSLSTVNDTGHVMIEFFGRCTAVPGPWGSPSRDRRAGV